MRLLYFSPVPWDSYEQRPHYFVRHFLAAGAQVLWIDPYPARLPTVQDLAKLRRPAQRLTLPRPPALSVLGVTGLPIDPLPGGALLNARLFWRAALKQAGAFAAASDAILGIGRPTALARTALESVSHVWSFYDAMDDFPEFYRGRSRRATHDVEQAIAARVSRLFVSSSHLLTKFSSAGRRVTHLPNAYDMALLPPPAERTGPDRLGFIGCMGRWFDWTLVARLAAHVQPMPVTLIGPLASPLPARLPGNVELEPPCHQRDAVERLTHFSAGLIPFTRTALTASIDPIKYYQYRGAGLPVLTTRFGEMARRGAADDTFFMDDDSLDRAVQRALACRATPDEIRRFRDAHTWTRRFDAARVLESA